MGERPTPHDLQLIDSVLGTQVIHALRTCNSEEFDKVFGGSLAWSTSLADGTLVQAAGWGPAGGQGGGDGTGGEGEGSAAPVRFEDRLTYAQWLEDVHLHGAWRQLRAVRQGVSEVRAGPAVLCWTCCLLPPPLLPPLLAPPTPPSISLPELMFACAMHVIYLVATVASGRATGLSESVLLERAGGCGVRPSHH